jgi:hypothetical protein
MADSSSDLIDQFEHYYTQLSRDSLAYLADIYSDDVIFIDPVTQHEGLTALHSYFKSLLENCEDCTFDIRDRLCTEGSATVTWQLNYAHPKLQRGAIITVPGISIVKYRESKIYFQQDYYDLGAMLYEHVPVLGRLIRALRKRLAA